MNLDLKIGEGGAAEVSRIAEFPGSVNLNSVPANDYIYEVSSGQQILATEFLQDNPFTVRRFADPSSRKEKMERQETTTVIINVPAFSLSMLKKCPLGLRLYRLWPVV